jgi:hypothetical protein
VEKGITVCQLADYSMGKHGNEGKRSLGTSGVGRSLVSLSLSVCVCMSLSLFSNRCQKTVPLARACLPSADHRGRLRETKIASDR